MAGTVLRCACGKRRSKWSESCRSCTRAYLQRLHDRAWAEAAAVNAFIKAHPEQPINYPAYTRPGQRGATVRYFYEGVPGIWSVDSDGNHWCGGPDGAMLATVGFARK